jgi:hypothetical protein
MRRLPGERSLAFLSEKIERDAAWRACLPYGPNVVYRGLVHLVRKRGWKDGAAYHAFKEIYGTEPRAQDRRGEPITPPSELAKWFWLRPKKSKRRVQKS